MSCLPVGRRVQAAGRMLERPSGGGTAGVVRWFARTRQAVHPFTRSSPGPFSPPRRCLRCSRDLSFSPLNLGPLLFSPSPYPPSLSHSLAPQLRFFLFYLSTLPSSGVLHLPSPRCSPNLSSFALFPLSRSERASIDLTKLPVFIRGGIGWLPRPHCSCKHDNWPVTLRFLRMRTFFHR